MQKSAHLIGSAEAADLLGIDRATFNRWAAGGRIEAAHVMPGATGARLFDKAVVEKLRDDLAAQKAAS